MGELHTTYKTGQEPTKVEKGTHRLIGNPPARRSTVLQYVCLVVDVTHVTIVNAGLLGPLPRLHMAADEIEGRI